MTQPTMEEIAGWLREAAECFEMIGEEFVGSKTLPKYAQKVRAWAAQVEAMGWKPINEAPKDGTKVDLWDDKAKERINDCVWKDGNWHFLAFSTYWFPLEREVTFFRLSPKPLVKK